MKVSLKAKLLLYLFLVGIGCFVAVFVQQRHDRNKRVYQYTEGIKFNTNLHVKYEYTHSLGPEIFARLDSFDFSLNPFNKHSVIYKVNNNIPVEVDDWFVAVFNRAQFVARQTGGLYDITVAPIVNLWGFGYQNAGAPTQQTIDSLKQFVGYEKVRLEGRRIVKDDPRLQINASSLAKGYAVDVIAELFDGYGIENYMVEIGGEVRAKGYNPKGERWKIEIVKPIDDAMGTISERQMIVALHDEAIATSANTRNYYIKDGKKYAHTINPVTGYPAENDMLSASVFYSDCITADAFATAFMVMGLEKSVAFAREIPDLNYVFIYWSEDGEVKVLSSEQKK